MILILEEDKIDEDEIFNILTNFGLTKKAKGIQEAALQKITFEDYCNCLFNNISTETYTYKVGLN